MRRIRNFDEPAILKDRWTQDDSGLRDKMLKTAIREVLMCAQLQELSRLSRFQPGDLVRIANMKFLRETYLVVRDKFIAENGGRPGFERDVERFLKRPAAQKRKVPA